MTKDVGEVDVVNPWMVLKGFVQSETDLTEREGRRKYYLVNLENEEMGGDMDPERPVFRRFQILVVRGGRVLWNSHV